MTKIKSIDINADVGEGVGNEELLFPYLSSCNIACGGHAGDEQSMRAMVRLAKQYNLKIGAHPSFLDRKHFGRKIILTDGPDLRDTITTQITTLLDICKEEGVELHHIKPHGALYNYAAFDEFAARLVIETVEAIDSNLILYAPGHSDIVRLAEGRLKTFKEVFAERNYRDDYSLVPRSKPKAILTDETALKTHLEHLLLKQQIKTVSGVLLPVQMDTLCVHGDHQDAVGVVRLIHDFLAEHEIKIQ
ncbi:5-oxoprolinase subunit PxpA [Croceiramulus getboli]|nr:5-oxoprolinase subunit PxpA [Flavobacteriaceae bacterium YJPT1-3]